MQQLRDAGLEEYAAHLECQQMRDELIAKRLVSSLIKFYYFYYPSSNRLYAQEETPQYDVHFHPAIVAGKVF